MNHEHAGHVMAPPHDPHHEGHGAHGAHDKHAGHSVAMFRDKFWLTLLLTIPTLIWGQMLQGFLGYTAPVFPGSRWIPPVFGTAVFLYGGWPFVQGAMRELRARLPGMMTLIALAITVAFGFSAVVTLGYAGMPLWEELATLVTIMLLGHWIEMRSVTQAEGALAELVKLLPDMATRVVGGSGDERFEDVPLAALAAGDVILIRPGASVAADGVVRSGTSAVNESMITGESRLLDKHEGDTVIAGTTNGAGSLRVEVTGTGDRTMLAGIMRLVEQAQTSRSRAQALADRAAFWLTIVALAAGAITLIAWLMAGATSAYAVERLVTVLVIACPHALGLAVPLVIAISTTLGARSGLLVRDRRGLEEARLVDIVEEGFDAGIRLGESLREGMNTLRHLDARISADGRHVVFASPAGDLVPGDGNLLEDHGGKGCAGNGGEAAPGRRRAESAPGPATDFARRVRGLCGRSCDRWPGRGLSRGGRARACRVRRCGRSSARIRGGHPTIACAGYRGADDDRRQPGGGARRGAGAGD